MYRSTVFNIPGELGTPAGKGISIESAHVKCPGQIFKTGIVSCRKYQISSFWWQADH